MCISAKFLERACSPLSFPSLQSLHCQVALIFWYLNSTHGLYKVLLSFFLLWIRMLLELTLLNFSVFGLLSTLAVESKTWELSGLNLYISNQLFISFRCIKSHFCVNRIQQTKGNSQMPSYYKKGGKKRLFNFIHECQHLQPQLLLHAHFYPLT